MHADNYMTNAMVDRAVSLMCKAVESTLRTCEDRLARDSPAAVPVLAPVAAAVRKVTSGFLLRARVRWRERAACGSARATASCSCVLCVSAVTVHAVPSRAVRDKVSA